MKSDKLKDLKQMYKYLYIERNKAERTAKIANATLNEFIEQNEFCCTHCRHKEIDANVEPCFGCQYFYNFEPDQEWIEHHPEFNSDC